MNTYKLNKYDLVFCWILIYITGKILWDKIPIVFEGLFFIIIGVTALNYLYTHFGTKKVNRIIAMAIIFSAYVTANALFQDSIKEIMRCIYEYVFYMFPMFSMIKYRRKINLLKCFQLVSKWGTIISILSWYEYFTHHYLLKDLSAYGHILNVGDYGFRAAVFTRSYLSHGVVLGVFSLISIYIWHEKRQIPWLINGVFAYVTIITTGSRGPLVAFGTALVMFFFLDAFFITKSLRKERRFLLFAIIIFFSLVCIILLPIDSADSFATYYIYRIQSIFNWKGDAGNAGRTLIWNLAINNWFLSSPIFGIGPSKTGSWGMFTLGVTESGVLRRLCEFGMVGFILFYTYLLFVVKGSLKCIKWLSENEKKEMVLWLTIFIGIFINDLTVQTTEEIMVSFWWWLALGGITVLKLKSKI